MKRPINTIKLIYFVLGLLISLSSYSKTKINYKVFDSERLIFNYANTLNRDVEFLDLSLDQNKLDFNGIDSYIDFGDNHDLTSSFSLEAWVLQEATVANGTIISKGNTKSGNKRGYQLALINNYPNITWYNATGTTLVNLTSLYPLTNNKWYHIVSTYDGATAKLYIDGLKVNEVAVSTAPIDGTAPFIIGGLYDSDTPITPKNYFNGFIDEVGIWNVALTEQQIRDMINQEIEQNGSFIKGKVTQLAISNGLSWYNLKGYYPMNDNTAADKSGNNIHGIKKNITTIQPQTAPLPYTTKANGNWTDTTTATPWTHGDSVWNIPNSLGVDGITPINWNIVVTNHNVEINTNTTLLGLIVNSNRLRVNGVTNITNGSGTGYSLNVTSYLKLNGKIDLEGESQLVQSLTSFLDPSSTGTLEKDQQGTADTFTYNYWSSPVGFRNNSTNNNSYKLTDVFTNIGFLTSGYNGSVSPLKVSDYWIWKFNNKLNDNFASWQQVRSTGTLRIGEGFSMKGPGSGFIPNLQNYVFEGKPNNGDINLTVTAGNDYLIGNPYPSAIDANQFIFDNEAIIGGTGSSTGTLYFWQHWGGGSHILKDYQGGYATYTLAGGAPSPSMGIVPPSLIKTPGRYIPVAQGFFISAETSGFIKFNNGQRVFQNENGSNSLFIKSDNTKQNKLSSNTQIADTRTKLRLGFNSVNTMRRQLLVTVDANATDNYDWGYDAPYIDKQIDDMYWMLNDKKYTIQGINEISELTVIPIGIHTKNDGWNSINIDALENAASNLNIFVHDKELDIYHDLKITNYNVFLLKGEYVNRFEITFKNNQLLSKDDLENHAIQIYYSNENGSIIIHNPNLKTIESTEIINMLGQTIYEFETTSNEKLIAYNPKNISTGIYIIKLKTESGIVSKKVLIK